MKKFQIVLAAFLCVGSSASMAQESMVTADDAVLCVHRENLAVASDPSVSSSKIVMSHMGCVRIHSGIRTRLLETSGDGIWRVRFFPAGISGGVELWALPSSFMNSDGSKPAPNAAQAALR